MQVGSFAYAGYSIGIIIWQQEQKGNTIEEIQKSIQKYTPILNQTQNEMMLLSLKQYEMFLNSLKEEGPSLINYNEEFFKEMTTVEVYTRNRFLLGVTGYYFLRQKLLTIFEQYEEALKYAERVIPYVPYTATMSFTADIPFYHTIAMMRHYDLVSEEEKRSFKNISQEHLKKLKFWADNCPENFQNCYALAMAEIARVEGQNFEAMNFYEEAIQFARQNGFIHNQALANELAGKFYLEKGFQGIAETYLIESYKCYLQWGAKRKTTQLEEKYPFLKKIKSSSKDVFGIPIQQLDLLSIIKALQNISREIDFQSLANNLIKIVIEQAHAEKAYLLIEHENQLIIAAEASCIKNQINVKVHEIVATSYSVNIPNSIIQYVRRTLEKVILDDVSQPNNFSNDTYFLSNPIKSIVCLPIVKQIKLKGILYLENNHFTSAFSPDKISILELLAAQSAISIENSLLFRDLSLSRQQLQDVMDNTPAIIYIRTFDGRYLFINRQYELIFNVTRKQIEGTTLYNIFPKNFANTYTIHDKEVIENGRAITFEETIPHPDGNHTYISVRFPLKDSSGNIYAICGISTDITNRKKTEEEVRKLNTNLEATIRELIKTNTDLDNFIYAASHNVKGPVSSLEGLINLLDLNLYEPEELSEIIQMMKTAMHTFNQTIDDLSELSKVQKIIDCKDIIDNDINETVEDIKSELSASIEDSNAIINVDFHEQPFINFSKLNFRRMLFHLIQNAIVYRNPNRRLEINIKSISTKDYTVIIVKDNGSGISETN